MRPHAGTITIVVVLYTVLSCQGLWAYSGGTGTPEDPYLISTPEDMNLIGLNQDDWDKHFQLITDIDLSGDVANQFNLIGLYAASDDANEAIAVPFSGVFDGQGHTIANFTYEVQGDENPAQGWVRGIGLFRLVDGENAEIRNLTLLDPNLYPSPDCVQRVGSVGTLSGVVRSGLVTACHVEGGSIRADGSAGGLVGFVQRYYGDDASDMLPSFSSCSANCEVAAAPERSFIATEGADRYLYAYYGGLLGFNSGTVSDCCAVGPVSGGQTAGGMVGLNYGEITRCQATGDVYGQSHIGGLAGESSYGTISSSWAGGDVAGTATGTSSDGSGIGGLVGSSLYGTLSDCYASGSVAGRLHVGGLVGGCNGSTVEGCYATGSVTAGNQQAGGLAGSAALDAVISECYACASVSVPWAGGGLVGLNGGTIQRSWADGIVSGTSGIGGLVGEHWNWSTTVAGVPLEYNGALMDCYALTDVICEGSRGGGLVGDNEGGTILRCFAAGQLTGSHILGGLLGADSEEYSSSVERSFWDKDATGSSASAAGVGLNTHLMQDRTTYTDAGWDLTDETLNGTDDIWCLDPSVAMYPKLAWEFESNDANDVASGLIQSP